MSKAVAAMEGLYKTYVYKTIIKDMSKVAQKAWKNRDDANYFLHRIGLSRYTPAKSTFSGLSLFFLGVVGGGIVALLFAPKPGDEIRAQLAERTRGLVGAAKRAAEPVGAQA